MSAAQLLPVFLVGLAGSIHCVGMCGGIVGALSASASKASMAPRAVIPVIARTAAPASVVTRVLAYNTGRIGSSPR